MRRSSRRPTPAKDVAALSRPTILVVDDDVISLRILNKILSTADYKVIEVNNGKQALEKLKHHQIGMVLSDVMMPVMDGLELLQVMQADPNMAMIPVMMITADDNSEVVTKALKLGAVDVIRKPFISEILLARVRNLLAIKESFRVSEQNKVNQQLLQAKEAIIKTVETDELTGLLTKQAFYIHVREYLDAHPGKKYEIIRFDLDNFSLINDILGVKIGDQILKDIGQQILHFQSMTNEALVVGHIEADHFAVLHNAGKKRAEDLFKYIETWLHRNEKAYHLNCRIGIYSITDLSVDPALMSDRALQALRSTKGLFSKRVAYYDDSMRKKRMSETELTDQMENALATDQFEIYYQPQCNYETKEIIGAEALVRWNHPQKGLLSPGIFLPLFERNGLIVKLDNYVWEKVCRQLQIWYAEYGKKTVPISVNISRMDTYGEDLCSRLKKLVQKYHLPYNLLRLEITESAYVGDAKRLCQIVEQLKNIGFLVEMDDFGSAYSSLNSLKDIPVDILKLDMKFLSDTDNSARSGNILSSVVRMARWLNLPVIAEGVETKQQADYLCSIGCLYMQGYYFNKPLPLKEFEKVLKDSNSGKIHKYRSKDLQTAERFWDASTQTALIFDSYVGGAIILQRDGDTLEMLRANDEFFKVIHVSRQNYLPYMLNIWQRFSPDDRVKYKQMLDTAATGKKEGECDIESQPYKGVRGDWTRNRAKLLARNETSEIFYVSVENITAEIVAQEALEKQTHLLGELYNSVPCGIVDYRITGDKVALSNFNDTAWKLCGFPDRETFRKNFMKSNGHNFVYEEDRAKMLEATHKAMRFNQLFVINTRVNKYDHTNFWCEVRLQKKIETNNQITLQSIFMDISDRKNAESQKYRKILFTIFDGIFLWDFAANTSKTYKSSIQQTHQGKYSNDLKKLNKAWIASNVVKSEQKEVTKFFDFENLQKECLKPKIPFVDYHMAIPGQSERLVRGSVFLAGDQQYLVCFRDITQESQVAKQAEEIAVLKATLTQQERYRIIVEQTDVAVVEWNRHSQQFYTSGTYHNYLLSELDPRDVLNHKFAKEVVYRDDLELFERFNYERNAGKENAEIVIRLWMKNKTIRWTRLRGSFLYDKKGEPEQIIITLIDIDDEIRAKEKFQEANIRLNNIISNIPAGVGIYQFYPPKKVVPVYISDRTCEIFGFTRNEYDKRIKKGSPVNFLPQIDEIPLDKMQQLKQGQSISIDRVPAKRKDGSTVWLRITCSFIIKPDQPIICYATLLDISNLVAIGQSADSLKELYQLVIESTGTITFDYSVAQDLLLLTFVDEEKKCLEVKYPNFRNFVHSDEFKVNPQSKPKLIKIFGDALKKETTSELDFQADGPDKREHWYHVKFISLAKDKKVYRIVGKIDNFDQIVEAQKEKFDRTQYDMITGLRSKDYAKARIEQLLKSRPAEQFDALIFLDIDNFKQINDTVGHLEADKILSKVGKALRKLFRSSDVVARFGGDEFLIYMVDPEKKEVVKDKAEKILTSLRQITYGDHKSLECSIGITGIHGELRSFDAAFRCADQAMYAAKQSGKNTFSVINCCEKE